MTRQAASNLDRLAKALDKAAERMSDLDPAAARVGALLVEVARRRAPVKTGRLRDSTRFNVRRSRAYRGAIRSAVTATASTRYAAPIHWGWESRSIRPQKFLTESLDRLDQSGKAVEIYTDAVVDALSSI